MRRSSRFLFFTAANIILFTLLPLHARHEQLKEVGRPQQLRRLHVADLCLATEARYTRHPALADRHAPFQEHPMALEHFPTGSLIVPVREKQ